jgi:hypothetical protein
MVSYFKRALKRKAGTSFSLSHSRSCSFYCYPTGVLTRDKGWAKLKGSLHPSAAPCSNHWFSILSSRALLPTTST